MMLVTLAAEAGLPRASAQDLSLNPRAITQFIQDITNSSDTELHHLLIVKDGFVVTELHASPYRSVDPHNQFSVSKMLTALAVGLAVDDGCLSLDDRLVDIFPDKCPDNISSDLSAITVRHLLTMTSGKQVDTSIRDNCDDWVASWLALPGIAPGKQYKYDTMAAFVLSAALQRVTGASALDLLNEHIFQPMEIYDVEWELSPDGVNTGGWGVRCSTETMAMLGQLLLQGGQWNSQRLISSQWVSLMCTDRLLDMGVEPTYANEYQFGYGYLLWRCSWDTAFRAEGNFGQFVIVDSDQRLVIAINGTIPDQSRMLVSVSRLIQNLSNQEYAPCDQQALDSLCHSFKLPQAIGNPWSATDSIIHLSLSNNSLDIKNLFLLQENGGAKIVLVRKTAGTDTLALGYNEWLYTTMHSFPPYNIGARNRYSGMYQGFTAAANYAWQVGEKVEVMIHCVDWYSAVSLEIDLEGRQLSITSNQTPSYHQVVHFTIVPTGPVPGDINDDGVVDIFDVNGVINLMLGK